MYTDPESDVRNNTEQMEMLMYQYCLQLNLNLLNKQYWEKKNMESLRQKISTQFDLQ